jgi:hypothetical protein
VLTPQYAVPVGGGSLCADYRREQPRLATISSMPLSITIAGCGQEGSFMRPGGPNATFTQQPGWGRVDITITCSNDATGASGSGLLDRFCLIA